MKSEIANPQSVGYSLICSYRNNFDTMLPYLTRDHNTYEATKQY